MGADGREVGAARERLPFAGPFATEEMSLGTAAKLPVPENMVGVPDWGVNEQKDGK